MRQILLVWFTHCFVYAIHMLPAEYSPALLFAALAAITQSAAMCLPMFVLYTIMNLETPWIPRGLQKAARALMPVTGIALLILLYANYALFGMYGFFIDPFVFNIISTPGGAAALGASNSVYISIAAIVSLIAVAYWVITKVIPLERAAYPLFQRRGVLSITLLVMYVVQAIVYAVSDYKSYVPVMQLADQIPWYQPVTAKSLLADIGVERSREVMDFGNPVSSKLFNYPDSVPDLQQLQKRYNIVWLVAESWRWDMLDPVIMPMTWEFAKHSQSFQQHYSTGNGTRMGIFGQFYGLNGSFWFPALKYQRAPLLINTLQSNDYNIRAHTSASFTYPEFDKTVWVNTQSERLHSVSSGMSWERDRDNVDSLLEFIEQTPSPFFSFMFFETTHANYQFPRESTLKPDYLANFNYLATDIDSSIDLIKNRYINASNYLDIQFGRIFRSLESQGRLKDTIVIVTGDHGEEFMENGRWGHNSTFSQQQIRVPLLIYVPSMKSSTHETMSSHMDIPATLLSILQPDHNTRTYSMGYDLLAPEFHREYAIVSDWHGDALITNNYKYSMSSKANVRGTALSTLDDRPIGLDHMPSEVYTALSGYLSDRRLFSRPPLTKQARKVVQTTTEQTPTAYAKTRAVLSSAD